MSNGESKIAISKAALCYGFAIALRALFLGILCWGIRCLLIASLTLAMTKIAHAKNFIVMLSVSKTSLSVIASKQQPQNLDTF